MNWNEFINKISEFKKEGSTGLNAPALIRLVYSGAFDSMLSPDHFKIPAADRYPILVKDILSALKSKATMPKKSKTDLLGITDITSPGHLMLWRYMVNPFVKYDVADYMISFLKTHGFQRPSIQEGDITWFKPESSTNTRVDIRYNWRYFFTKKNLFDMYKNVDRLIAVAGIIVKAEKRMYQGDKESLVVQIFNGHEYTDDLRMWPGSDGKLNKAVVAQLTKCSMGLAIIKPSKFRDKPSGTLVSWIKLHGTN